MNGVAMINLIVSVKQAGKRKPVIGGRTLSVPGPAETLEQLIRAIVTVNVERYNNREIDEPVAFALTESRIAELAVLGKVAFGVRYNPTPQNLEAALENARLGFLDGLYKVFVNEEEIADWQQPLALRDNDRLLFVRLAMLAG